MLTIGNFKCEIWGGRARDVDAIVDNKSSYLIKSVVRYTGVDEIA